MSLAGISFNAKSTHKPGSAFHFLNYITITIERPTVTE
jgi:hypothetical protein